MTTETTPSSEYQKALDRVTRLLAYRDHSRLELTEKLEKDFSPELIEQVLGEAEQRGWLAKADDIAARAALAYQRAGKSRGYIEGQLRKKGLPVPELDDEAELENVRRLCARKFGKTADFSFEERGKAYRFLKYRGFSDRAIKQVLNEKS